MEMECTFLLNVGFCSRQREFSELMELRWILISTSSFGVIRRRAEG